MELKEAYEILKKHNNILRLLPPHSPLWKRVVIEILEKSEDIEIIKAAIVIAGHIEDAEVAKKLYDFFKKTKNDEIRKKVIESWNGNLDEKVIEIEFELLGVRESPLDRYVRQIASHNIVDAIKKLNAVKPNLARIFISKLRNVSLHDSNTFTRMNTVIIMRLLGDKMFLKDLEKRLEIEKKLIQEGNDDVGIPFVIREIEKTILFYKEKS
jgi:hypothetical protein